MRGRRPGRQARGRLQGRGVTRVAASRRVRAADGPDGRCHGVRQRPAGGAGAAGRPRPAAQPRKHARVVVRDSRLGFALAPPARGRGGCTPAQSCARASLPGAEVRVLPAGSACRRRPVSLRVPGTSRYEWCPPSVRELALPCKTCLAGDLLRPHTAARRACGRGTNVPGTMRADGGAPRRCARPRDRPIEGARGEHRPRR
jgi:hypothetical protein